eukprot:UN32772
MVNAQIKLDNRTNDSFTYFNQSNLGYDIIKIDQPKGKNLINEHDYETIYLTPKSGFMETEKGGAVEKAGVGGEYDVVCSSGGYIRFHLRVPASGDNSFQVSHNSTKYKVRLNHGEGGHKDGHKHELVIGNAPEQIVATGESTSL